MLPYLLILISCPISSIQGICQKKYAVAAKNYNPNLFAAILSFVAMLFFILRSGFKFDFSAEILPYSVVFAVTYATATSGTIYAVTYGALSMTSLIISYSVLVPAIFGIAFLNERPHKTAYVGIILVCISLYLVSGKDEKQPLSLKWLIAVIAAFWGNGICSATQKYEQAVFNGGYKNEFMIAALFIASVLLFAVSRTGAKHRLRDELRDCGFFPLASGIANGINNLLVMIMAGIFPATRLYPTLTAYGMTLTYIISRFMFNEKLTKKQTAGYITGAVSIIFLNI